MGMRILIKHSLEITLYTIVKYRFIIVFIALLIIYYVYYRSTFGLVENRNDGFSDFFGILLVMRLTISAHSWRCNSNVNHHIHSIG